MKMLLHGSQLQGEVKEWCRRVAVCLERGDKEECMALGCTWGHRGFGWWHSALFVTLATQAGHPSAAGSASAGGGGMLESI